MLSSIFFWLIWFFIFIPVFAWILGFALPIATQDSSLASKDSNTIPITSGAETPLTDGSEGTIANAAPQ